MYVCVCEGCEKCVRTRTWCACKFYPTSAFLGEKGLSSGRALWGINRRQKDKGSPSLEKACGCVLEMKAGAEGFCSYGCSVWTGLKSQEGKDLQGVYEERSLLLLTRTDLIYTVAVRGLSCSKEKCCLPVPISQFISPSLQAIMICWYIM